MNTISKKKKVLYRRVAKINLGLLLMVPASIATASLLSIADQPLFVTNAQKANVMVVLDNSNSMDEGASGAAVGSDSPDSKSEIARNAVKDLITTYSGKINMGLVAYQQSGVSGRRIHNTPYDASYNPANYDPSHTFPRDSLTKKYRTPNTSNPGTFIYYNVALPFYAGSNQGTAFCYSATADFDNGSETYPGGPWDFYNCWRNKTDLLDTNSGFSTGAGGGSFFPTDSDLAQNILDFGTHLAWYYVGRTWFSNSSPGKGYLHVPIADLDATQATALNNKLAVSQFVTNGTSALLPLQNAGLTPIEGTLLTVKDYFEGNLAAAEGGPEPEPPESCGKNFVALMTDGLPSVAQDGTVLSDPAAAITAAANAAAALQSATIGVKNGDIDTYVIGFALPFGTDPTTLDQIAVAGGTSNAYLASDPVGLVTAFNTIFKDILEKTGASSSAATNSTSLSSNSHIYQARFDSGDWTGQLLSKAISDLGVISAVNEWDAGIEINSLSSATRKIITTSRDTRRGIAFQWSVLDALTDTTQKDFLNADASGTPDGLGSDRVVYIRGDDVAGFRPRPISKLGDIINSSPFFLGPPDAGYNDSEMPGYSAFRSANYGRAPMIFAGANDGMLHAFDASSTTSGGKEIMAFVPSPVYKNLSALTDPDYGGGVPHKYYVDGSPMVADANLGNDATPSWKTVLAGGLNAGGQAYYALDVTDLSSFAEADAANTLLWEFTDEDDADLGYSFNQATLNRLTNQSAQIARMQNGKWALIVGNGYNNTEADGNVSATGHASLFILFLDGGLDGSWTLGSDYIKIDTKAGDTTTPNGLATPRPIDSDGDGRVDTVYAGDLLGNVWKFDLSNSSTASWGVAYGTAATPAPLYTAKDSVGTAQPITTAPLATLTPDGDMIIGFATGLYLGISDISTTGTQSIYGIVDSGAALAPVRSILVAQTVDSVATVTSTATPPTDVEIRISSQNSIDYTLKKGWYMDLPESGERVVFNPILRDGRFVFTTLTPNTTVCEFGGSSWLMELDYLTGGRLNVQPFSQVGKQGTKQVSGIRIGNIMTTPTVITDRGNQQEFKIGNDSSGTTNVIQETVQFRTGRLLWREIR